ncbi:hypothetical protein I553_4299 [Mycobacterium xenopi 4042]|uniref:Uncharacterized protein n=1 Tax=Mycobacterium xenopi 4042 TaxID=1299334 RepID=X8AG96_MYCXE|nr:hypothetical protein I553_4299 [Mycobacterium xenopi 4042]
MELRRKLGGNIAVVARSTRAVHLAPLEIEQPEASGLEQAAGHLVLPAGHGDVDKLGRAAFHCARRLRVFARDVLRLGTAMIGPYSS